MKQVMFASHNGSLTPSQHHNSNIKINLICTMVKQSKGLRHCKQDLKRTTAGRKFSSIVTHLSFMGSSNFVHNSPFVYFLISGQNKDRGPVLIRTPLLLKTTPYGGSNKYLIAEIRKIRYTLVN